MEINLTGVNVSGNGIKYKLHIPRYLRKYFLNDASYVRYDSGVDLAKVDPSILAIPMVASIAPVAWAVGAGVRLDAIDATYLQSLSKIKDIYRSSHPNFAFSGDIRAKERVTNVFGGNRTGMLFSGGVDSLTSYLRYKNEKPDFISVWGLPDIAHTQAEFWDNMWADICSMADIGGVRAFQIKTDLFSNINHELLIKEFGVQWFTQVAGGLFVLSLCAPVTAAREIANIIFASSFTEDFKGLQSSHPSVVNNISWADVNIVNDGHELSRQQKLQYLHEPENVKYLSRLRVCWESAWKNNCGCCEKCMRTIAGLIVEGLDPNSCNFNIDESTLTFIKDCLCKGKIALDAGTRFIWEDIQRHIPEQIDGDLWGSREFLTWLKGYDLSKQKANRIRMFLWEIRRLRYNRRFKAPVIRRKIKCHYYILLAKLRLL